MDCDRIPFNRPYMTGKELWYISQAHHLLALAGDGHFTKLCHRWLESHTGSPKALLTHSCTAALEMAALLLNIQPGDEIVMPSFTFVSTANAFVLRGGVPVFVDIRQDTLNLDERLVEEAVTPRTRAVVPVHYAGVACEMDALIQIARRRRLRIVEDAAQGLAATYDGRPLGGMGDLGAFSFHETKNVISGEGGALAVNDPELVERAEIIREKGTDRSRFFRGEVDKYTWQDMGSSFLPGELIAAFLWAQLEEAEAITAARCSAWNRYHEMSADLERRELLRRPVVPEKCRHNAHMYYILLPEKVDRQRVLSGLAAAGIYAVFHYVPLHASPAGRRFGRVHGSLEATVKQSERLIRLPLWVGIGRDQQARVIEALERLIPAAGRRGT